MCASTEAPDAEDDEDCTMVIGKATVLFYLMKKGANLNFTKMMANNFLFVLPKS